MRFMQFAAGLAATMSILAAAPSRADVVKFEYIDASNSNGHVSLSDDGRFVAFQRDDQVYVRDRQLGRTLHASVGPNGASGGYCTRISGDGRYVTFVSSTDLTGTAGATRDNLYVRDLALGQTDLVTLDTRGLPVGAVHDCAISADGRFVAFESVAPYRPDDLNQERDVYLRDRLLGRTELVSVDRYGGVPGFSEGSLSISDDGRYVSFTSYSHDLIEAPTPNGGIYVRDRLRGTTELVTRNSAGQQVGGYLGMMTGDGRYVAFMSPFWNMAPGDTNRVYDVYVRDRVARTTERVSISSEGVQGNGPSGRPGISDDGRMVAFISQATNLVAGDTDGRPDVFVHDRVTRRTSLVAPVAADSYAYINLVAPPLTANGSAVALWTDKVLAPADGDRWTSTYLAWLQVDGDVYDFTVKPFTLSFGERPLGSATHANLWLRNKGGTALPILRVFVRGTDANMFTVGHACGATLAPGAGCAIAVTFAPSAAGFRTAKVVLIAGERQVRERVVTGIGTETVAGP